MKYGCSSHLQISCKGKEIGPVERVGSRWPWTVWNVSSRADGLVCVVCTSTHMWNKTKKTASSPPWLKGKSEKPWANGWSTFTASDLSFVFVMRIKCTSFFQSKVWPLTVFLFSPGVRDVCYPVSSPSVQFPPLSPMSATWSVRLRTFWHRRRCQCTASGPVVSKEWTSCQFYWGFPRLTSGPAGDKDSNTVLA